MPPQDRWFIGAVYFQPGDYDRDQLRAELRRMKELGFTIVRFHTCTPEEIAPGVYDFTRPDDWLDIAAEVGIGVIFHAPEELMQGSEALLSAYGYNRERYRRANPADPQYRALLDAMLGPLAARYRDHPALYAWGMLGEPSPGPDHLVDDDDRQCFADWLRARYSTLDALDRAWNIYPARGKPIIPAFEEAWRTVEGVTVGMTGAELGRRSYGAVRDLLRFQTDQAIERARIAIQVIRAHDPNHPTSTGSHQLFLNQPSLRWDTAQWARLGDLHTTSIHLSWHFEAVAGEVDRPVYLQARLTRDSYKDGWTSAYETTGGAVQYSGGYGNAMSAGLMRRLICAYLAAGNTSIAFWTWNARPGWWESGEYGLISRSGALTPWALEAGNAARGLARFQHELAAADQEAGVAIGRSWNNEAILLLEPDRHDLNAMPGRLSSGAKMQAAWAGIGAGRALLNRHVPFAFLDESEILAGAAHQYPTLYLPHFRAVSDTLGETLLEYVEQGGRLIADVQFGFCDEYGKLRASGPGTLHERIFGGSIDTIHDTRTAAQTLGAVAVEGFYGDLLIADAQVLARFASGMPAIIEARRGRGTAVLLGFDAARMCHLPGRQAVEDLIARLCAGHRAPAWSCDAPLAFRMRASSADHYFFLNDGPARTALLHCYDAVYHHGEAVLDERPLATDGTLAIELPAESAVWLRFARHMRT